VKTIVLEVIPQKLSGKVARQLFGQVWENLGKNPLHSQTFACSYTYAWTKSLLFHFLMFFSDLLTRFLPVNCLNKSSLWKAWERSTSWKLKCFRNPYSFYNSLISQRSDLLPFWWNSVWLKTSPPNIYQIKQCVVFWSAVLTISLLKFILRKRSMCCVRKCWVEIIKSRHKNTSICRRWALVAKNFIVKHFLYTSPQYAAGVRALMFP